MKNTKCQGGQPANQLVILKGSAYYLCDQHVQILEKLLGEKLEPLTRNYYEPKELTFKNYVRI